MKKKQKQKYNKHKAITLLVLSTFIIGFGILIASGAFPSTSVSHYYNFDEGSGNLLDQEGSSDGDVISDVEYSVDGLLNTAFNFTGGYVNFTTPHKECWDLECSISIWTNQTGAGGSDFLYWTGDSSGTENFITLLLDNGDFYTRLRNNTGVVAQKQIVTTHAGFSNSYWNHIVATFNSTDMMLYTNGTLFQMIPHYTPASAFNPATNVSYLGTRPPPIADNYLGRMDEVGIWDRELTAAEVSDLYNNGAGEAFVSPQGTTLNSPEDLNQTIASTMLFNATVTTGSDNLVNATLWMYEPDGTLNNSLTQSLVGVSNSTELTYYFITEGNHTWNILGCDDGVNCNFGSSNRSLIYGITNITQNQTINTYETERIYYNVSFEAASTPTATLYYNGSAKTATMTNVAGNLWRGDVNFLQQPAPTEGLGTKGLFWEINNYFNTSVQTQTNTQTNLTECGVDSNNAAYLNFTFLNETTAQEPVNASVPSSTWIYYLADDSVNKSLSFSDAVETANYTFCFRPASKDVSVDLEFRYTNTYSQQRTYAPDTLSLTNSSVLTTLFLLPTSEGIFVTFQVINSANQPLEDALVVLEDASGNVISQTTTGASGTTAVFLNPNNPYTLTVSKSGFTTFTATQTFTTSEFTVTLGGTTTSARDLTRGITNDISPPSGILFNNTNYEFNLTLTSSEWALDSYGFSIYNSTKDIIAVVSDTNTTGGFLSTTNNTGDNAFLSMNYYWVINGNYTNATVGWLIKPEKDGSIRGFFNRLNTYLDAGLLGINGSDGDEKDFNRTMIFSLIIFLAIAVVVPFKFGITSGATITGFLFGMVLFFTAVGAFSLAIGVPMTVFSALLFFVFIMREVAR